MIRLTIAQPTATPDVIMVNGVTFLPTTRADDRCHCGHRRDEHRDGGPCFPDHISPRRVCSNRCQSFRFDPILTRAARADQSHG